MHGLGNDYLYVYADAVPNRPEALIRRLSDRHFGAGSDGMIWILPSEVADFQMRIFNADGSEAAMCGNGIRCVGKYVYDKGHTDKLTLTVETRSGVKTLAMTAEEGRITSVRVNMGQAAVQRPETIEIGQNNIELIPVDMGNPHAVVFVPRITQTLLTTLGPALEQHPCFPDGVNVELVERTGKNRLRMRVWERGSGVTMACGTGACACAAAAIAAGLCEHDEDISVQLDGGVLTIRVDPSWNVTMTGPAETVYEGEVTL